MISVFIWFQQYVGLKGKSQGSKLNKFFLIVALFIFALSLAMPVAVHFP